MDTIDRVLSDEEGIIPATAGQQGQQLSSVSSGESISDVAYGTDDDGSSPLVTYAMLLREAVDKLDTTLHADKYAEDWRTRVWWDRFASAPKYQFYDLCLGLYTGLQLMREPENEECAHLYTIYIQYLADQLEKWCVEIGDNLPADKGIGEDQRKGVAALKKFVDEHRASLVREGIAINDRIGDWQQSALDTLSNSGVIKKNLPLDLAHGMPLAWSDEAVVAYVFQDIMCTMYSGLNRGERIVTGLSNDGRFVEIRFLFGNHFSDAGEWMFRLYNREDHPDPFDPRLQFGWQRDLLDMTGGKLNIEDTATGGVVTISLPVLQGPRPASKSVSAAQAAMSGDGLKPFNSTAAAAPAPPAAEAADTVSTTGKVDLQEWPVVPAIDIAKDPYRGAEECLYYIYELTRYARAVEQPDTMVRGQRMIDDLGNLNHSLMNAGSAVANGKVSAAVIDTVRETRRKAKDSMGLFLKSTGVPNGYAERVRAAFAKAEEAIDRIIGDLTREVPVVSAPANQAGGRTVLQRFRSFNVDLVKSRILWIYRPPSGSPEHQAYVVLLMINNRNVLVNEGAIEVAYDIYTAPVDEAGTWHGLEKVLDNRQSFVRLRFDSQYRLLAPSPGTGQWDEIVTRERNSEKYPWLNSFLKERLTGLVGRSFDPLSRGIDDEFYSSGTGAARTAAGTPDRVNCEVNFSDRMNDEITKRDLEYLFINSKTLEKTLKRVNGIDCSKADIGKVVVSPYSFAGTHRDVYAVKVTSAEGQFNEAEFILKISRTRHIPWDPTDIVLAHDAQTKIINEKLGIPFGVIESLRDGSLAVTGPLYRSRTFDESIRGYKEQMLVVKEAVSVWKKLGGYFVWEPHRNQFMIDYSKDGHAISAHLIDKGHHRIRPDVHPRIYMEEKEEELVPVSRDVDLTDLSAWLLPVTASEVIFSLIDNLEVPPPARETDSSDPDASMTSESDFIEIDPKAVVRGIVEALGPADAAAFFTEMFRVHTHRRKEYLIKIVDALKSLSHPVYMAAMAETAGGGEGTAHRAVAALNAEVRNEGGIRLCVSKLHGTCQKLRAPSKFKFCLPVDVLRNSPDIALALESAGLLKQRSQEADAIEFELVITGVTDNDAGLIDGFATDGIRKALRLPGKFTVSGIPEAEIRQEAERLGYSASDPKGRVAVIHDFFAETLADGEYMAIATDPLKTKDDAHKLQTEIETDFGRDLQDKKVSICILVGPETGKGMFSLSGMIDGWLEKLDDALARDDIPYVISIITPVPAPLTPELEAAMKTLWEAISTAA
ncbi:MAG: hypothetical protein PHS37_04085 [Candidatus Omnitrophica bacterium]|nr:hypothetical protein [Candidatus Omnitrophota bacterium]